MNEYGYGHPIPSKGNGTIGGGAIQGAGAIVTARAPMVTLQMELLEKSTSVLHEMLSQLEQRLSAITTPETPSANANVAREGRPHPGVALASNLMEINSRVEAAASRVNDLLGRIEL
jgi:hypothetical protein